MNLLGKILKISKGTLIKYIDCPIDPECVELKPVPQSLIKKHCAKCNKDVVDINEMNCDQVEALLKYDPNVCFSLLHRQHASIS